MLNSILKFLFISFCSIYTYTKLLHITFTSKKKFFCFLNCTLISFLVYYICLFFPSLKALLLVAFVFIFSINVSKIDTKVAFITSILSCGINFTFYTLLTPLFSLVAAFFRIDPTLPFVLPILLSLMFITQFFLIHMLFKVNRLKSGMPFLFHKISNDLGIIISILIIIIISLKANADFSLPIYFITLAIILISSIIFYSWWKQQLKKSYYERISKNENENLRSENALYKSENDKLSAIVHRDNKLITALRLSVLDFTNSCDSLDKNSLLEKKEELIRYLDDLSSDRIIDISFANANITFNDKTDNINVDSVILFLSQRAQKSNVDFSFVSSINISKLFDGLIKERSFNTLLSDLAENAIIAVSHADTSDKKVHIELTTENGYYCLNIYDNGPDFDMNVLLYMGIKRYTTHENTGGSGIGLMTTYEILRKFYATFVIDETLTETYTKKVSVQFDGMHKYLIKTNRDELKKISVRRKDITII